MDQSAPSEVLAFAPQEKSRHGHPIDQAGHNLIALLREAATISSEKVEYAISMAHKSSIQLREAKDRIAQLETTVAQLQSEIEHLQSRTTRAEGWLDLIKREIEDKLIAPMQASRDQQSVVH